MQKRRYLGSSERVILHCLLERGESAGRDVTAYASPYIPDMKAGHLYTVLNRMLAKALVTKRATQPRPVRGGRGVYVWSITDAGRAEYEKSARLFAGEPSPA